MPDLVLPKSSQIENALSMGWEYLGDGIFAKGEDLGYFTRRGFRRT